MNSDTLTALQEFFKSVLITPNFDYAMVRFLRRTVANFLLLNSDLHVNGLSLRDSVQSEYFPSFQKWIEEVVLKDKEDARSGILAVIPLVLRISLVYVFLDSSDKTKVICSSKKH